MMEYREHVQMVQVVLTFLYVHVKKDIFGIKQYVNHVLIILQ